VDAVGVFQNIPRIDDSRPAEIFAREVLGFPAIKELLTNLIGPVKGKRRG
jgi:hypothetical protein